MTQENTTQKNSKKNVKKRHWGFFVYPDSAPPNWREILQGRGLQCAISPLHDKDKDPEPDNPDKKAHYHVIAVWSGPTTFNVAKSVTDSLNQPIPQPIDSIRGYYRYFTHKDNPEKYQYDEKDITTINGFAITDYVELTRGEVHAFKLEIQEYIQENDIDEYFVLLQSLKKNGLMQLHEIAINHTIAFNAFLTSKRHTKEHQEAQNALLREKVIEGVKHELMLIKLREKDGEIIDF